jgi:glycosyltransferase involved in cell wall biosynthesis
MAILSAQPVIASAARTGARPRVLFMSDHLGHARGATHGSTTYFLHVLPKLQRCVDLTVCYLRERHAAAAQLEAGGVRPLFLNRGKWDPRVLRDLLHVIRERGIEIVHTAGMKGILFGRLAARLGGARAIIHLHDTKPMGRILGAVQRRLAGSTGSAIAISHAVAAMAEHDFALSPQDIHVLYNPLPIERYGPDTAARMSVRRELAIEPDRPVVGVIGRFAPEKGQAAMLRASALILDDEPDAVVLFAGDGVLRGECEALARRLGIAPSVRFAGHREDVPEVLAAVDVVAVPSVTEGLGYAAMEAMAAGRPVVAFAVGGLPEVIGDGENGLLVPPGDEPALASAIVRVLRSRLLAEALVAGGRARVRHFTVDSHVKKLVEIYERIAVRGRSSRDL